MTRLWYLTSYDTVLPDFLDWVKKDPKLEQDTHACLHALREQGNLLSLPMSRSLGKGIFELRPHANQVEARLLYYFGATEKGEPKAVFTNTFIKKTRATPREEINLAKSRRKELEDQEKANRKRSRGNEHGHRTYH